MEIEEPECPSPPPPPWPGMLREPLLRQAASSQPGQAPMERSQARENAKIQAGAERTGAGCAGEDDVLSLYAPLTDAHSTGSAMSLCTSDDEAGADGPSHLADVHLCVSWAAAGGQDGAASRRLDGAASRAQDGASSGTRAPCPAPAPRAASRIGPALAWRHYQRNSELVLVAGFCTPPEILLLAIARLTAEFNVGHAVRRQPGAAAEDAIDQNLCTREAPVSGQVVDLGLRGVALVCECVHQAQASSVVA